MIEPDVYKQFAHDALNITGRLQSLSSLLSAHEPPSPDDIAFIKKVLDQDSQKLADSLTLFCLLGWANANPTPEVQDVDIALLAQEAASHYLDDPRGPVVLDIGKGADTVISNKEALQAVVQEMVKNAVRHKAQNTAVDINLAHKDGQTTLQVRNTPHAAPPPDLTAPLSRHKESKGLGLGLALITAATPLVGAEVDIHHEGDFFTCTLAFKAPAK